ncbi:translation elongation factor G [Babesia ovis]|uniref:Translation elongation factor G n=1 Tax=Babesia ovis TaxID=5869 RepID=A0A9W5TC55_BABOV|nr:translation elongation factor G [Babesia ovis]
MRQLGGPERALKLLESVWYGTLINTRCGKRLMSTSRMESYTTKDIRNIGIVAHIDAGKTTLAEALIERAHVRNKMGSSSRGIQLDFIEQEIKRGITIRSACSSFKWNDCYVNVIDTPGHTDFSGEVFNAMDVIDGCIIVIDGTKGVQAQTRHLNAALPKRMPKAIFINKMDRPGISIDDNIQSIRKHLRLNTVLVNVPRVDTVDCKTRSTVSILDANDGSLEQQQLAEWLTDCLCNIDDELADVYLTEGSVPRTRLVTRLVEHVHRGSVTPVLCGSAATMAGVDHLLDAVCQLFPHPSSEHNQDGTNDQDVLLYTFKTLRSGQSRIHAFCKVVTGALTPGMRLHNLTLRKVEQADKIYKIQANVYQERKRIVEGDIAMVSGMEHVRTGHVLAKNIKCLSSKNIAALASKNNPAAKYVCFATFTAKDEADSDNLVAAMENIKIEDPTVYYRYDPDAVDGLVVGGYGEFHIEVIAEILKDDYDKTHVGIQLIMEHIKCMFDGITQSHNVGKDTAGSSEVVENQAQHGDLCQVDDGNIVFLTANGTKVEQCDNTLAETKTKEIIENIKQLLHNAMAVGPLIGGSMINTKIKIAKLKLLPTSTVAGETPKKQN